MATRGDYPAFAAELVEAVGGPENIQSVTHCMTRLRFVLHDESIVDDEAVKRIKGTMGVVRNGGQYQIPIGTYVNELFPEVEKLCAGTGHASDVQAKADSLRVVSKDSWYNRFFKTISGCIMPAIGPMAAGGILKGLLTILVTIGVMANTDGTYLVLYAASDAIMYFMPIIFGFSAGKVFGMDPYVSACIGGALLYPQLAAFVGAEEQLTFLGLPVTMLAYQQTLLPILLAAFVGSKIEQLAKKIIPTSLRLMFVPCLVLTVTVPLALLVIGPAMTMVSNAIAALVNGLYNTVPVICGGVLGAFWQLFVMMGIHSAMIPIILNNLTTLGYCPINAVLGLTVWALAGVSLGYALRVKNPEAKANGFGTMASALCGITEPTIYTVALTNMKRFVAAFVGGGIAGIIAGLLGIKFYTWAGDGIFRIPGMINPAGLDISFYGFIVCAIIAFVISAIGSYLVTDPAEDDEL